MTLYTDLWQTLPSTFLEEMPSPSTSTCSSIGGSCHKVSAKCRLLTVFSLKRQRNYFLNDIIEEIYGKILMREDSGKKYDSFPAKQGDSCVTGISVLSLHMVIYAHLTVCCLK